MSGDRMDDRTTDLEDGARRASSFRQTMVRRPARDNDASVGSVSFVHNSSPIQKFSLSESNGIRIWLSVAASRSRWRFSDCHEPRTREVGKEEQSENYVMSTPPGEPQTTLSCDSGREYANPFAWELKEWGEQNAMKVWLLRLDLWQAICFWIWNLRGAAVFLGEWFLWWYRLEAWGDNFQYISGTKRNQEIIWMWISFLTSWSTTRTAKRFLKSLPKNAKIGFEVSFVALTKCKLVLKCQSAAWTDQTLF